MALTDAQTEGRILEGIGPTKVTVKASTTIKTGDIIGYSSGWMRALATVSSVVQGLLVAGEDGAGGDEITAFAAALVDGRYSGGTPGARAYVAETTLAGKITETAPSTTNDANTDIGFCVAADTYWLRPGFATPTLSS